MGNNLENNLDSVTPQAISTVRSKRTFLRGVLKLLRHFPYTEFLAVFFPFYAYLIANAYISSPSAILLLVPFVLANAAGFIYNNINDVHDPSVKNPITAGEITLGAAKVILILVFVTSIASFLVLYNSQMALVAFAVYWFFGLTYSGLGLRFKETLLGPVVASFAIWVGGPLVLTAEFSVFNSVTIPLLVGSFFVYVGRETYHTIIDYENDLKSGNQTLAVKLGLKGAYLMKNFVFLLGSALFISSVYSYFNGWPADIMSILLIPLVILSVILEIAYDLGIRLYDPRVPYLLVKLFYVWYAGVILNLGGLITVLLVWVFLTSKRS